MPIKNYTTKVDIYTSLGEIQGALARAGAEKIMVDYVDGKPTGVTFALYRDNFTCRDCGEFHAFINEHGMPIPIDDGELEVHHIKPVSEGGGDEQQNLVTLCKECHKKRHRKLKASDRQFTGKIKE